MRFFFEDLPLNRLSYWQKTLFFPRAEKREVANRRKGSQKPERDLSMSDDILSRLMAVLEARKGADPETSYVASLYHAGLDAILEKIDEETAETIVAAKSGDKKQIVYETADLWFHSLVLLAQQNLTAQQVLDELDRRFGLSGIDEKAARQK